MTAPSEVDPFATTDKAPSLSFKNAPVGTTYTGTVTADPKLVQSRDYKTGEPAFWPAKPGETPNPKMSVVINLTVDGEPRSLWATKPSAMFAALADAQRESGIKIGPGVKLSVRFTGEKELEDKKKEPQKLYAVKLEAAPPEPAADPFVTGDTEPPW